MQSEDTKLTVGVYTLSPVYEVNAGSLYLGTVSKTSNGEFHASSRHTTSHVRAFDDLGVAVQWLGFKGGINPTDPTKTNQPLTKE